MIKICWFDTEGRLINIGEWDDMNGMNPIPSGAYCEEREVVLDSDGGWRLADVPQPLSNINILGQQLVQKELEILDLRQQNAALGNIIVDLELRLLALEGGAGS